MQAKSLTIDNHVLYLTYTCMHQPTKWYLEYYISYGTAHFLNIINIEYVVS